MSPFQGFPEFTVTDSHADDKHSLHQMPFIPAQNGDNIN